MEPLVNFKVAKVEHSALHTQRSRRAWSALKLGSRCHTFFAANLDSLEGAGAHIKRFACTSLGAAPADAHMDVTTPTRPIIHPCPPWPRQWQSRNCCSSCLFTLRAPPLHSSRLGLSQHSPSGNKLQTTLSCCPLCQVSRLGLGLGPPAPSTASVERFG